jgi:hypothetical protein
MTEPAEKCDCPGEVYIIEVRDCGARVNGEEVEGLALAWVDKDNKAPSHICGRNWAVSLATDVLKGRQIAGLAIADLNHDDEIEDEEEE